MLLTEERKRPISKLRFLRSRNSLIFKLLPLRDSMYQVRRRPGKAKIKIPLLPYRNRGRKMPDTENSQDKFSPPTLSLSLSLLLQIAKLATQPNNTTTERRRRKR